MPTITKISIQAKNKERCNIDIDGEFALGVSLETVYKHHLKKGLSIDKETLDEITLESEKNTALAKAINYVSKTLKTKWQVVDYLRGKGYTDSVVFYAIDKLKEYDLINDVEYAKRYLESRTKVEGKKLADYKLLSKGVSKEDIEKAWQGVDCSGKDNAKVLAEKYLKNKEKTKENILKTMKYLLSRGYSYEEVEYAVKEYKED